MVRRLAWVVAVVVVANAAALTSAARNRRGVPDASLQLTERELRVAHMDSDTTGMTLWLRWNRSARTDWLQDRAKVASLGLDCSMPLGVPGAEEFYRAHRLSRPTYLVLEYDESGELASRDPLEPWMNTDAARRAREEESRLRPVDAGNDPLALRQRYADRHRYLISAATIRLFFNPATQKEPATLTGIVQSIDPSSIYVPKEMRPTIAGSGGHYKVTLEYGSRLVPRIVAVAHRSPQRPATRE